jgi:hypothetical protein
MAERLDAVSVRESNGKSYFTRIGVAFPSRTGNGYSVLLDAMPAPTEGQFKILLMEPKARDGAAPARKPAFATDLDDDVPFD